MLFQQYDTAPIHAFLEFLSSVLCTIFFSSHWLLSNISLIETMDSGERGINPVTINTMNPLKEYCPIRGLNQRPVVLQSCALLTELCWFSLTTIRYALERIVGKGKILVYRIYLFSYYVFFFTEEKNHNRVIFRLSSGEAYNLDRSEIYSSTTE